jgi:ketosteroid isomerase-like protein
MIPNGTNNESMSPVETAQRFIDCINSRDAGAIAGMMTPDHRFIDSEGAVHEGRGRMEKGWEDYFRLVPDYEIAVERIFAEGSEVVILGAARGTYCHGGKLLPEDAWATPAVWFARIKDGLVHEWRVYADNEPMRARMRAHQRGTL